MIDACDEAPVFCKECGAEESKYVIEEYGICRKCISDNLRSWELAK